jgi:hypothetical protein
VTDAVDCLGALSDPFRRWDQCHRLVPRHVRLCNRGWDHGAGWYNSVGVHTSARSLLGGKAALSKALACQIQCPACPTAEVRQGTSGRQERSARHGGTWGRSAASGHHAISQQEQSSGPCRPPGGLLVVGQWPGHRQAIWAGRVGSTIQPSLQRFAIESINVCPIHGNKAL